MGDGEKQQGRNGYDVAALILLHPVLLGSMLAVLIVAIVLTVFDLVNVQYDNGLKLRVGVDQNSLIVAEKKKIEERAQEENELAINRLSNKSWNTEVLEARSYSGFIGLKCQGVTQAKYSFSFGQYDKIKNVGEIALDVRFNSSDVSVLRTEGLSSGPSEEENCYAMANIKYMGESIWEWGLDGLYSIDDSGRTMSIKFVQNECISTCIEYGGSIEIINQDTLVFRGPSFAMTQPLVISLHPTLQAPPPRQPQ